MSGRRVVVRIAETAVAEAGETLVTVGLGSCVAVMLLDRERCVGGLAHVLLPDVAMSRDRSKPGKFASTAVPHLIEEMVAAGARRKRLEAYLVGGASMFSPIRTPMSANMGERNVAAVRAALDDAGIKVSEEKVGGEQGRTVHFDPREGRVIVSSAFRQQAVLGAA